MVATTEGLVEGGFFSKEAEESRKDSQNKVQASNKDELWVYDTLHNKDIQAWHMSWN